MHTLRHKVGIKTCAGMGVTQAVFGLHEVEILLRAKRVETKEGEDTAGVGNLVCYGRSVWRSGRRCPGSGAFLFEVALHWIGNCPWSIELCGRQKIDFPTGQC